mmetsp:Transcript_3242/g.10049  ORF Transcript_3242/g.10049 Transcript_3242/m.10049 type:complete len:452 (-) Transcript_3242:740-2095(-)
MADMSHEPALVSTWAAQPDLPPADEQLVEAVDEMSETGEIGSYEIKRLLGEGEFAAVYECSRPGVEGTFAMKAINKAKVQRHNNLHKSKRNIRRVNTEVMAMRRFTHGGICQLHDVMQSPTMVYLVMEMGERDLFSFLDDHPDGCPEMIMKMIARILALGLRHCHNHGVAHRDIKPENILVCGHPGDWNSEAGIVKLCDFGLCAPIQPGVLLNDFVGSPGFFAPELMMRRMYDGACADMWSLGAVMVEMFLGHKNFDALWCPPYEHLSDVAAFSQGVVAAVGRVKLGCHEPPSEPVRKLLDQLLQIEPERRATIEQVCSAKWFELLRVTKEGYTQLLRLTFDRDAPRNSFGDRPSSAQRRVVYRDAPRELATIPSLDSAHELNRLSASEDPHRPWPSGSSFQGTLASSFSSEPYDDTEPMAVDPLLSKIQAAMSSAPQDLARLPDVQMTAT